MSRLTQTERAEVFRLATRSLVNWYADEMGAGMNDAELKAALERALGIFGGSGARGCLHVTYTGAGLRIWGGWHIVNHCVEAPLFSGNATIAMAREIYEIRNPDDDQLSLL